MWMKKIWKEIVFDIRKNPFLFLIMTVQLTIHFTVSLFSNQLEREISDRDSMMTRRETEYYSLIDNLVGQYEEAFFQNKDGLGKLKIMYAQLISNDYFEYLETYNNPIVLVSEKINDEVLYRYESGDGENYRWEENGEIYNEIKCFWMSCNVGDFFDIQCREGSIWTEETKNEVPVPIVLGSTYGDIFEVGEIIDGISPAAGDIQFRVCGILEEGEYLIHSGRVLNLDRYVLVPMQDAKSVPINKEESCQKILYLFKINGTLSSDLPANELQNMIHEICETSGVTPSSSVAAATNTQSYIVHVSMQDILDLLKRMLIMLKFFSSIATILYILMKIDRNKEYYSILVLNGFSVEQIMSILLCSLLLLLVISQIIAEFIFFLTALIIWETPGLSIARILIYDLAVAFIVGIVSYIKLETLDVGFYIR